MKKIFAVLIVILLGGFYILGCGPGGENFGDAPSEYSTKTAIEAILSNSQDYIDKEVVIEGKISSECPSGGWINIMDMSGLTIYVEMHGTSVPPIPQRIGSKVLVKGTVYRTEGEAREIKILAKGLVIK